MGAAILFASLLAAEPEPEVLLDRPVPERATGRAFRQVLDRRMAATWRSVPLRRILRRIGNERKIAILLDGRIDPGQELPVDVSNQPVREALQAIAEKVSARAVVVGNTVYIGPPERAGTLRTLVRLRTDELFEEPSGSRKERALDLVRKRTVHWNDLDRPADIVQQIAERYGLQVRRLDRVPHDLWARGTLPEASAPQALSLILIQFDLTFVWTDDGGGIRIGPVPENVAVERTYASRGMSTEAALERIRAEVPGAEAEVRGDKIHVRGTVDEQEAVAALLDPTRNEKSDDREPPVSLERQQFTLTIRRVPVRAVMKKLAESGVRFKYDAEALKAAGIDLNQKISLQARDVTAAEFFRKLFGPLGLEFAIDGATVRLTPR